MALNKSIGEQFQRIYTPSISIVRNLGRYKSSLEKSIPHWNTRERDHPALLRFGFAILLCFSVFYLKLFIDPYLDLKLPFSLFYSTILFSSWYGGFRPGIFATFLSAGLVYYTYFLSSPQLTFGIFTAIVIFMFEGTLITLISNSMHKAFQSFQENERYVKYYASNCPKYF